MPKLYSLAVSFAETNPASAFRITPIPGLFLNTQPPQA